jgi:hypothetical protein
MNTKVAPATLATFILAAPLLAGVQPAAPVSGQDTASPALTLEPSRPQKLNRVGLSYRMGLNITADFKKLGGYGPFSNPGPATGSVEDRTYDNGYNLVDSTGNNHGGFIGTWNWGYQDSSSVQGDSLVLHSASSPANAISEDNSDGPQHGMELSYARELGHGQRWRYGAEVALGWMPLHLGDSRTLRNTVNLVTDTFTLGGVVPPPAPYDGTFEGPGPVIGSAPDRVTTVVTDGATITGHRTLDADIFSLRLGPYAELPLTERWTLDFCGGLMLIAGQTDFSFQETVTVDSGGTISRSGSGSDTDFMVGGYVGASVSYALTEDINLFAGAQFEAAGQAVNQEAGKESALNLNQSAVVMFGVSYRF